MTDTSVAERAAARRLLDAARLLNPTQPETAADATDPARVTVYDLAWQTLTGRTDQWGGCADSAQVERIADVLLAVYAQAAADQEALTRARALAATWEARAATTRATPARTLGAQWNRDEQARLYDEAAAALRRALADKSPARATQEQ